MNHQSQIRIYEYVADDGTTYWSFTQHPTTVSPPKRLVLQSRKGIVLGMFLVALRNQGMALLRSQRSQSKDAPSE